MAGAGAMGTTRAGRGGAGASRDGGGARATTARGALGRYGEDVAARFLSDAYRHVLDSQLKNALKQQPPTSGTPNSPTSITPNPATNLSRDVGYVDSQKVALVVPPAAPRNLWGEPTISKTRIAIGWGDVSSEDRYELRASNEDSGLFYTKTLPAGATTYVDEIGLYQTGAFVYELKACNQNGCSDPVTVVVRL